MPFVYFVIVLNLVSDVMAQLSEKKTDLSPVYCIDFSRHEKQLKRSDVNVINCPLQRTLLSDVKFLLAFSNTTAIAYRLHTSRSSKVIIYVGGCQNIQSVLS